MFFPNTFRRRHLAVALSTVLLPTASQIGHAQQLEEVIVTATKRSASTQDIPVTVSAITGERLEQLGVTNFEDYLIQLPGISAGGSGPGQNTIYIRGIASTTPALTTAGVAGIAPNVAFYLDEQPLAQPGRNLDVYAADLNRVEVLAGPQGTLFGASSQAGTVRMITNKPDFSESYGKIKAGASTMSEGGENYNVEAMFNWAVSERFAVRAVVYNDDKGGYIDNVRGQIDASESARFRPEGTMRSNGVPVSSRRAGFQSTSDLSNVNFIAADNEDLVEKDFNETTYRGARIAASYDINDRWNLLVAHTTQDLDADGVFYADPDLDDLEIQVYNEARLRDDFDNTAWTLTGSVGSLDIVYTGAFTKRESDQVVEYTDYLFVGQYLPYYICDSSVTYPGAGGPSGSCFEPNLFVTSYSETEVQTHEFRISTDPSKKVRATAGVFYSDLQLDERNDFGYPSNVKTTMYGVEPDAWPDNFPYTTGFTSDPGPFPDSTIFRNDVRRTDEQWGFFGEVSYDISDQVTLIAGARHYDVTVDLEGSANGSFFNPFYGYDCNVFGTDISDLYNGDGQWTDRTTGVCEVDGQTTYTLADLDDPNTPDYARAALGAPDTADAKGEIYKFTAEWKPNSDVLLYATYSEGFRPGLLNRPGGATTSLPGGGSYSVPYALDTDELKNYELGWKTDWLDGTLRFNGAVFFADIADLQTTIFDPSIVNLFFSDNAADAEVRGLEGDFTWLPGIAGLTLSGAFSFLDTEITRVITPTDDVRKGDSLAFAPEFQGNLTARYEWLMGAMTAHVMGNLTHSESSYSDIITINRDRVKGWTMVALTAGVRLDSWSAELFVDNVTDERAELTRSYINDRERITYARPRTMGMRVSFDF
jgi:outer membrane receptor protein involved in Fe transport